jgi:hypothetical protein
MCLRAAAGTSPCAKLVAQSVEPAKLVAPMIARFMATDRGFAKMRRERKGSSRPEG